MFLWSTILFALAALGGLTLAAMHFRGGGRERPPTALAVVHGLVAAAGFLVLLAFLLTHAGALIGLAGILLFGLTVRAHKRSGNDPHPTTPTVSLITSGPYQFSRHPGYLGFALAQTGIAVAVGSVWALGSVIVSLLLAHYLAALPEEAYLERKFGERYRQYEGMVRRWI